MRLVLPLLLAMALPAAAQIRPFNCVGAAGLEDDNFAVSFAPRSATLGEEARSPLAAAAELARQAPERNICVLGHALSTEGGATTGQRLAAVTGAVIIEAGLQAQLATQRLHMVDAEERLVPYVVEAAAVQAQGELVVEQVIATQVHHIVGALDTPGIDGAEITTVVAGVAVTARLQLAALQTQAIQRIVVEDEAKRKALALAEDADEETIILTIIAEAVQHYYA
jgi:hypothetical protein